MNENDDFPQVGDLWAWKNREYEEPINILFLILTEPRKSFAQSQYWYCETLDFGNDGGEFPEKTFYKSGWTFTENFHENYVMLSRPGEKDDIK